MLKKDDIFIDWSLWSVAGPIVLSILWFECGLSSNQVRTNDARNVVFLVVDPSSIHHYIFWVWPMLSPCSHDGGSPVIWKFRWVVVESIDNILISSMMLLNIKLVLETFESIFFMLAHEVLVWWKEWLPLIHVHFDVSCRREFEKVCFCSFGIIPSRSCTCEEFCGLLDWSSSFHMCPEHTKTMIDLFKEKKFLHKT